jgi:hypothetical protein
LQLDLVVRIGLNPKANIFEAGTTMQWQAEDDQDKIGDRKRLGQEMLAGVGGEHGAFEALSSAVHASIV